MDDLKKLWWNRARGFWSEAGKYLKIIITGYAFLPMILLLVLGSLYKVLLQWLPTEFPVRWVMAFILALLLSHSPMRTFIKKADLVFLLPLEQKLPRYFMRSYVYSFLIQGLGLTVILFLLAPLYTVKISPNRKDFYLVILAVIILKAWNLFLSWQGQKESDDWRRKIFILLCFLLNITWCLVLLGTPLVSPWMAVALTILLTGSMIRNLNEGYPWLRLLDLEENQKSTFYSFTQWFMDIPEISRRVGDRNALISLINWIPHEAEWAYSYKFLRSFIRFNDLFYGYLRIVVISIVLLAYVNHIYLSAFLLFLSLLLNTLHLANGWNRVKDHFWYDVYPLPRQNARKGFVYSVAGLLVIHLVFIIFALFNQYFIQEIMILLIVGLGSTALIARLLLPKLIKEI